MMDYVDKSQLTWCIKKIHNIFIPNVQLNAIEYYSNYQNPKGKLWHPTQDEKDLKLTITDLNNNDIYHRIILHHIVPSSIKFGYLILNDTIDIVKIKVSICNKVIGEFTVKNGLIYNDYSQILNCANLKHSVKSKCDGFDNYDDIGNRVHIYRKDLLRIPGHIDFIDVYHCVDIYKNDKIFEQKKFKKWGHITTDEYIKWIKTIITDLSSDFIIYIDPEMLSAMSSTF
jgi:hypothetical protein